MVDLKRKYGWLGWFTTFYIETELYFTCKWEACVKTVVERNTKLYHHYLYLYLKYADASGKPLSAEMSQNAKPQKSLRASTRQAEFVPRLRPSLSPCSHHCLAGAHELASHTYVPLAYQTSSPPQIPNLRTSLRPVSFKPHHSLRQGTMASRKRKNSWVRHPRSLRW